MDQMCERCFARPATGLDNHIYGGDIDKNKWMFTCDECEGSYGIAFERLNEEWEKHLDEKTWFRWGSGSFFPRFNYARKQLFKISKRPNKA